MTHIRPFSRHQRAAALVAEGICLLPPLLAALWSLSRLPQPPPLSPFPAAWQPYIFTAATALLYGAVCSPLRLWRIAVYCRLCGVPPSSSRTVLRQAISAVGWRWRLWWRRAGGLVLAALPSALLWGYGSLISKREVPDIQPLLCLLIGGAMLLCGVIFAGVRQCRYALAPLFVLAGFPAETAMTLSAERMRSRVGAYVNFLGGEAMRLLACLLIVPAPWLLPGFRQRRLVLLSEWMQPTE